MADIDLQQFAAAADAEWADKLDVPIEAQDLIDSYLGRAGLLASAIMMGLTEPDVEINPDVMLALGNEITERVLVLDPEDMRTTTRVVRALRWATRDDVQPEVALAFYARVNAFVNDLVHAEMGSDEKPVSSASTRFCARFKDTVFADIVHPTLYAPS